MKTDNPYGPPETRLQATIDWSIPTWLRHLAIAVFLFPVWFVVGGAISIGGSPIEGTIDALLFLMWLCYAAFALLSGIARAFVHEQE